MPYPCAWAVYCIGETYQGKVGQLGWRAGHISQDHCLRMQVGSPSNNVAELVAASVAIMYARALAEQG
eukprot:14304680-Alexandrium_andersonii.AAC.1